MSDEDIIIPSYRKTKNDEKAKRRFRVYKKGGHNRYNLCNKQFTLKTFKHCLKLIGVGYIHL